MHTTMTRIGGNMLHVHDIRLMLVRAAWLMVVALTVLAYIVFLPGRYDALHNLIAAGPEAVRAASISAPAYALYHVSLETIFAAVWLFTGALIFLRRPDDGVALLVSFTLVIYGVRVGGFSVDAPRTVYPEWGSVIDTLQALSLVSSLIVFYVFPNGRFVPRWTIIPALLWSAWAVTWVLFPNSPINLLRWAEDPAHTAPLYLTQAAVYGTGVLALYMRYRRESSAVRYQQARWVVLGLVTTVLAYMALTAPYVVVPAFQEPGLPRLLYGLVRKPLLIGALAFVPVCLAIAMLRYRLWNVDLVINRALVYGVLTAVLGAIYLGSALLFQSALHSVTRGHLEIAVVISTLAIAGLFAPMRQRVQTAIDRHFFRSRHYTLQALADFSAAARDEVDLTRLIERLETTVWDTLKPAHVLTWLRTPAGYSVPVFSDEDGGGVEAAVIAADDPLVTACAATNELLDLADCDQNSAGVQRLRRGRVRYVAPLLHQGELIGWLSLGPRHDGQEYRADDRRFLAALCAQAAPALRAAQLVHQQQAAAVERERMQQELRFARVIQQTLLPHDLPAFAGWQMAVHYQPAGFVGGDFYDVLHLEDGQVALIVADVMDKGIPAALVMATTRAILRGSVRRLAEPGAALERANDLLYLETPDYMYVTCLVAILDPASGRLRYANAGHNLPYRASDGVVTEMWAAGMPLGLMPNMHYEEHETVIEPGETALFYSDGVVEAHDMWGEMFGYERLQAVMRQPHAGSTALVARLLDTLSAFTGSSWQQEDDITVLALKRLKEEDR